jgi:small subunit ribosomal protein S6
LFRVGPGLKTVRRNIMRNYEMIFIAQPELGEEEIKGVTDKVREIIGSMNGDCRRLEDWGVRKLAYPVKKCLRGRYFFTTFAGSAPLIAELERRLRLDDKVLRYQSVRLEKVAEVAPPVAEEPVVAETAETAEQTPEMQ